MPKGRNTRSMRPIGVLFALGLIIGLPAAIEMWHSHSQTTSAAERAVAALAGLLAEQTERTIQAIDLTLISMRDTLLASPQLPSFDSGYGAALKERLKSLPYVRSLLVIGADGMVAHDTTNPPHETSLDDRPYFRAHKADPGLGLRIGKPLRSRTGGSWFVSFSRRIDNPDGSFGGVVVAAVEPRYFNRLYKGLLLEAHDLIALLLKDGTLLARTPNHEQTMGKTFMVSPLLRRATVHPEGVVWNTSPIDGTLRLVAYRQVAGSLLVFAGRSRAAVYDSWRDHAAIVGGGSILVWVLSSGLALLWFQYRWRAQLERDRLAQGQRLEMMGRIAGGIAHDLGNTIKIARTTFTLLKPSLASQREAMTLVEDADRSLKSAFEIIDRLLAFARRQELSPKATDLRDLILGFAPILRQAAGPSVQLELDLAGPLVSLVDPIHLESALLNLVLNGKDAMPDGGRIVIELKETQAPRTGKIWRGQHSGQHSGGRAWAQIVVRDNGSGMTREVRERAFDPFFTTRAGGSGLGLSQVLGFVKQSAGEVWIDSKEGEGTAIVMLFPTAADAGAESNSVKPCG